MKLTLQDVRTMTHGALDVREVDGKFVFTRFTDRQQAYYEEIRPDFGVKAHATSGVRLEFLTDAAKFSFDYRTTIASSREFYYFDVFVDGVMVEHFGELPCEKKSGTVRFTLPEGSHLVTLYFPNLFAMQIANFTLSDGATVTPVKRERKLLMLGDSITQGYDALYASQSYANLVSDMLGMEVFNQAIGGEVFRPDIIDGNLGFTPDTVIVAYGSNDYNKRERENMVRDASEFFRRVREAFPKSQIFAILPIWRADSHRVTGVGTFEEAREIVRAAAERQKNVTVINSDTFIPRLAEFFSDKYLHPNDLGFRFYADGLLAAMKKQLN